MCIQCCLDKIRKCYIMKMKLLRIDLQKDLDGYCQVERVTPSSHMLKGLPHPLPKKLDILGSFMPLRLLSPFQPAIHIHQNINISQTLNCSLEKCFASFTWGHAVVISTGHVTTHQTGSTTRVILLLDTILRKYFLEYCLNISIYIVKGCADSCRGTLESIRGSWWWWNTCLLRKMLVLNCHLSTTQLAASWLAVILKLNKYSN